MVTNNAANAQNAQYNLLVGTGSAYTNIAPSATSGVPLISQGAASNPAYGTAVVAGGGTGVTSNTAYSVLCGGTTSTNPIQSVASVGSSGQVLTSNGAGALPTFQGIAVLQQVRTNKLTVQSITASIPNDDTKPQITEGTEVLSLSITPKSATSILQIQFIATGTITANAFATTTLFEAASTNAIQVSVLSSIQSDAWQTWSLMKYVTSGTTSTQTYSIRMGTSTGTLTINGYAGNRFYGGAAEAELIITEYAS